MQNEVIIDGVNVAGCNKYDGNSYIECLSNQTISRKCKSNPNCYFKQLQRAKAENEELKKLNAINLKLRNNFLQENNILKAENEKLKAELKKMDERMSEVIYRATGGRLCYSTYTLDAIEQAFQDQLEILSDRKMEELRDENKKLKEIINNMRYPHCADCSQVLNSKGKCTGDCTFDYKRKVNEQNDN